MKKIVSICIALFSIAQITNCQITEAEKILKTQKTDTIKGWRIGGVTSLNLAQTSLTNWAAGGEKSFAVNGLFSIFANYKKEKAAWDNSLDIGYGVLSQGDQGYRKTDDKIDFLSKYGQEAMKNLYYAVMLNFKTQMKEGYDYAKDTSLISTFLAPAYIVGAIGLDYKPSNYFSAFAAPLTGKITIVNNQELADKGAFGVKAATFDSNNVMLTKGEKVKNEFGGYVRVIYSKNDFKSEILKNVSITTKVDAFSNYMENPQNIDISWENQIAFKVNKYISVNFNTHLLYDDDTKIQTKNGKGPRIQFKEILGVGFSYKF
jgi:hypothetical protein